MRIVSWNIRAGGGGRVEGIAEQLLRWAPDVVCLCEYRGSPPGLRLAALLREAGFEFQLASVDPKAKARNALLLASRLPLSRLRLRSAPLEPGRWLAARVGGEQPFALGLMHAPNMVTGRKSDYLEAIGTLATGWRHGPAVFLGDTNCGWPGIDEERPVFGPATARWLDGLAALGWRDAFRLLYPHERFFTWYSPNGGNGFRLDQAFVNRRMAARALKVWYEWGRPPGTENGRRDVLSDHAALLLDFG